MIFMKIKGILKGFVLIAAAGGIIYAFTGSVSRLGDGHTAEDKLQLEDTLRRTAAACYAAEGIYPPNVEYMEEHYGIHIDDKHFVVKYDVIASNLMPDITVLEIDYEK